MNTFKSFYIYLCNNILGASEDEDFEDTEDEETADTEIVNLHSAWLDKELDSKDNLDTMTMETVKVGFAS